MRLRWDWLAPMITVPYVPTLGPVHPDAVSEDVFADVIAVAGSGRFVPYDKARLWGGRKREHVLAEAVVHTPEQTLIPTLTSTRRGRAVRTYGYGDLDHGLAAEVTAKLRADLGAESGQVTWFDGVTETVELTGSRVLLNDLRTQQNSSNDHGRVSVLSDAPDEVAATFADFAAQSSEPGMRYLSDRRAAGRDDGPVLVVVGEGRVVGAIGPLRTLADPRGVVALAPQYFAVLPEYRGRGHGRALWRAAMAWGRRRGAAYQLLQAQARSRAERLYLAEGLTTLGHVLTVST